MLEYYNLIWDWLVGQYGSNDFLVGTTLPFVLGAIVYFMRSTIIGAYQTFLRYFTVTVRLNSTTEHYDEMAAHIFRTFVWGVFKRDFVVGHTFKKERSTVFMSAGYGRSIALINGYPGLVIRQTEDSDAWNFKEWTEVRALCFRPAALAQWIFKDLQKVLDNEDRGDEVTVYRDGLHGREEITTKPLRPLSTVFLPEGIKNRVMDHLEAFQGSEAYCVSKGIPWHTGLILHGVPGTGKTSFIHAIASELGRDIHYHSSGSFNNIELDSRKSILVLEDFDTAGIGEQVNDRKKKGTGKGQEQEKTSVYNLSDVLNFLDGFLTPHGLVVIATTNRLSTLDEALVRPGRFDLTVEIDTMQYPEYVAMCEFHGQEPVSSEDYTPKTGADLTVNLRGKS
jgi:hypothetical protein